MSQNIQRAQALLPESRSIHPSTASRLPLCSISWKRPATCRCRLQLAGSKRLASGSVASISRAQRQQVRRPALMLSTGKMTACSVMPASDPASILTPTAIATSSEKAGKKKKRLSQPGSRLCTLYLIWGIFFSTRSFRTAFFQDICGAFGCAFKRLGLLLPTHARRRRPRTRSRFHFALPSVPQCRNAPKRACLTELLDNEAAGSGGGKPA